MIVELLSGWSRANRRENPRFRRVRGFAGTESATRKALGANRAAGSSGGANLRGVSGRVEADNAIERAYLTERFQAWAQKSRSSIERSGIHAGGSASLLRQMLQDLRDFRLILDNGDNTHVGATFITDERIYFVDFRQQTSPSFCASHKASGLRCRLRRIA